MTKAELPIPIHHIAMLQAYLYEIFGDEKECENDFKYTKWYLSGKFTDSIIEEIINFFKNDNLKCDCDVFKKFDLREIANRKINFHNEL